jgi:hypothetical protein
LVAADVFAGIMLNIGNPAAHWILAPHPDASTLRAAAPLQNSVLRLGLAWERADDPVHEAE